MKTTLFSAVLALFLVSCQKDYVSPQIVTTTPEPALQAKIFPTVTEPREATLGESSAVFIVGERLTIYVPYEISNDDVSMATITITDENGNAMESFEMINSSRMMPNEPGVPLQLQGTEFLYATIELGEELGGKTLGIQTHITGNKTTSDDYLPNAFSVKF
ncbi:MAG TPA: hypothetical protein VGD17_00255 [Chitinophagaceae bacterium]